MKFDSYRRSLCWVLSTKDILIILSYRLDELTYVHLVLGWDRCPINIIVSVNCLGLGNIPGE